MCFSLLCRAKNLNADRLNYPTRLGVSKVGSCEPGVPVRDSMALNSGGLSVRADDAV